MHQDETDAIITNIHKDDIMLEWGAGGSTLLFSQHVKEYYSIESNEYWFNEVKKLIGDNVKLFLCLPIPKSPVVPSHKEDYLDYINKINYVNKRFDKILVDGRARTFCAEKAVPFIKDNGLLFFHDWNRPRYHTILKYYTIVDVVNQLAILRKKVV